MITLEDVEARSAKAKKLYPDLPLCGTLGCERVVDATPGLGLDTSCAYHRLLFDHFLYEVNPIAATSTDTTFRRGTFDKWVTETGQEECDRIVLESAQDPINWKC